MKNSVVDVAFYYPLASGLPVSIGNSSQNGHSLGTQNWTVIFFSSKYEMLAVGGKSPRKWSSLLGLTSNGGGEQFREDFPITFNNPNISENRETAPGLSVR